MKTKIAINGFGRIGRAAFKIAFDRDDVEVVAVNDLTDNETLANLLKFDSSYGRYHNKVEFTDDHFTVNDIEVRSFSERDPKNLPWGELGVDVVIESTGVFRTKEKAYAHIEAGAKKVIISAPAKDDETATHVIGVNEDELDASDAIISNASCTTNCISPVMAILESSFGVEKALMTTIHSYTADQNLQDGPHSDARRSRAAALNIVPTTTGAALATGKVIPSLQSNFDGMAVRVPTPTGSLSDFSIVLKKDTSAEEVNRIFIDAADQPYYQGVLTVTDEPIVSSDIIGDSHSSIVDLSLTKVVGGNLLKIVAWYDNEWGYSNRLVEMVVDAGHMLHGASQEPEQDDSSNEELSLGSDLDENDEVHAPEITEEAPVEAQNEPQSEEVAEHAPATQKIAVDFSEGEEPAPQSMDDELAELEARLREDLDVPAKTEADSTTEEVKAEQVEEPVEEVAESTKDEPEGFSDLEAKIRADLGIDT